MEETRLCPVILKGLGTKRDVSLPPNRIHKDVVRYEADHIVNTEIILTNEGSSWRVDNTPDINGISGHIRVVHRISDAEWFLYNHSNYLSTYLPLFKYKSVIQKVLEREYWLVCVDDLHLLSYLLIERPTFYNLHYIKRPTFYNLYYRQPLRKSLNVLYHWTEVQRSHEWTRNWNPYRGIEGKKKQRSEQRNGHSIYNIRKNRTISLENLKE